MANMDDIHYQLRRFAKALDDFNVTVNRSYGDLKTDKKEATKLWRHDSFQKRYDARWEPLSDAMNQYAKYQGHGYYENMKRKIQDFDRYLRP